MNEIELEKKYAAHTYHPLPIVLVKGKGAWVWDNQGKKYLDMLSAYSAVSHGHCHPKLVAVLQKQLEKVAIVSRAFYNDQLGPLMQRLCELTGLDMAIPMNTGAEAVETAIKAIRLWGHEVKKVKEPEIIVASGNFHGRTTTIISFSSEESYKKGFDPLTPGFKIIPFGDAKALEKAISSNTCAFLIEPIQGEAGVVIPPKGYLARVAEICKTRGILFVVDEIQSGLGRAGKMFAYEHEHVKPDGIILGKALGGGLLPVSAFVAKKEILELFKPGSHGSTFGGNSLGSAVALEALKVLEEERLVEKSAELGAYLLEQLRSLKHPGFKEIRGRGLWIGAEVNPKIMSARKFCEKLMQRGILAKETHEVVIRFAPPLVITKEEIDWAIGEIRGILDAQ
jgi:ornithine--oxo-acid transaminase